MVFSSPFFISVFLPVVLALCWASGFIGRGRRKWRLANISLLTSSLLFYFWGEGFGVLWLIGSVLFNATCAKAIARRESPRARKSWLAADITGNLLFLGWFKYAAFAATSIDAIPGVSIPIPEVALPLGISFYTFQAMSYVIDVYRRDTEPADSVIDFACYVTMFPQLVAGPIVRYVDIARQLKARAISEGMVASGFRRFLAGFAKKMIVANTVGEMADEAWAVVNGGHALPCAIAWVALVCYTLQIYYDFSGYSDMAIGMGRMLGFEFRENFLHPYCSRSIREFWRRWHVSLSTWFRDYLYIPLGGNRKGAARAAINSMVVFALCGLWHGASWMFLLWGLWHGAFLMIERFSSPNGNGAGRESPRGGSAAVRLPSPAPSPRISESTDRNDPPPPAPGSSLALAFARAAKSCAAHCYVILVFMFGWVLFRSDSLAEAGLMLQSLAGLAEGSREARPLWASLSPKIAATMLAGIVFAFPVVPWARAKIGEKFGEAAKLLVRAIEWLILTLLGAISILLLAGGSYNAFLYFRF